MAENSFVYRVIHISARVLCISVIIIGLLVLTGWMLNVEILRKLDPYSPSMNPVSAILFIISGVALFLVIKKGYAAWKKKLSQILSLILVLAGLIKLLSNITGVEIPIDQILFSGKLYDPDRGEFEYMAPITALNFILLGGAILLLDKKILRKGNVYELLCISITIIAMLSLYGYIYGVNYLYGTSSVFAMALFCVIAFLFISLSVLFSRPERGSVAMLVQEAPIEVFFWRFFALFSPLTIGWLKLWGQNQGFYTEEFGTALFAVFTFALTMFLLGRGSVIEYKLKRLRERTEKIIKEDAKRLNSILDNSSTLIYIKDLSGRFVIVNKQFESFYELEKDDIIGKTASEIFLSRQVRMIDKDEEIIRAGQAQKVEETFISREKFYSFLTIRFPLRDINGTMYSVCGISTDISKLKEYELNLIEKEKELRAIIDNIGEGVSVADSSGLLMVNKQGEKITGFGAEKITPEEWSSSFRIYYPDGKRPYPSEKLPLYKALKGEFAEDVELFIKNPSFPEGRLLSVTGRPVIKEDGSIIGVVVYRDITEWRKLEEKLRENEKTLSAIIDHLSEGIVVADARGVFLIKNKMAEKILGERFGELNYREWYDNNKVFYPDGITPLPFENLPLYGALKGESSDNIEFVIKNKYFPDGKSLSASGRPLVMEDGRIYGIVVFRDISNRVHLQDMLRDNEKQLKAILSTIGEGVVVCDKKGRFLHFNKKAVDLLGRGALNTSPFKWAEIYDVFYPDGKTPFPSQELPLFKALKGETLHNVELLIKKPEGEDKLISVSGTPVKDAKGNVTGGVVDFRDITEYNNLKELVQEIGSKYKSLLELVKRPDK